LDDGLLDELKGKTFSIDWRFSYGTPFFQRIRLARAPTAKLCSAVYPHKEGQA
jgi:hypothetical protein